MSQERKVILLGDSGVGKTSLLQKYLNPHAEISEEINEPPTISSQYEKITIKNNDNVEVQLNVWDTAGQERYRNIIQLYMRDVQVAFICFDFNSVEITSISKWCELLQSYSPKSVLFLVATKIDLCKDDTKKVKDFIAKSMSKHNMFFDSFLTSAINGDGIKELFEMAANVDVTGIDTNKIIVQDINSKSIDDNNNNNSFFSKCCK